MTRHLWITSAGCKCAIGTITSTKTTKGVQRSSAARCASWGLEAARGGAVQATLARHCPADKYHKARARPSSIDGSASVATEGGGLTTGCWCASCGVLAGHAVHRGHGSWARVPSACAPCRPPVSESGAARFVSLACRSDSRLLSKAAKIVAAHPSVCSADLHIQGRQELATLVLCGINVRQVSTRPSSARVWWVDFPWGVYLFPRLPAI
mmetsp:Transcript_3151/g.7334  ORF Transcript_3151/g.7334 Transcript_3151/m.7334 type:complete len:210 (+) Transcript_3151:1627-2256(+)